MNICMTLHSTLTTAVYPVTTPLILVCKVHNPIRKLGDPNFHITLNTHCSVLTFTCTLYNIKHVTTSYSSIDSIGPQQKTKPSLLILVAVQNALIPNTRKAGLTILRHSSLNRQKTYQVSFQQTLCSVSEQLLEIIQYYDIFAGNSRKQNKC